MKDMNQDTTEQSSFHSRGSNKHRRVGQFKLTPTTLRWILILLFAIALFAAIWLMVRVRNPQNVSTDAALESYRGKLPELKQRAMENPEDYEVNNEYAYTLYVTSNDQEAIDQYRAVVDLNPLDAKAWNNMGNIYRKIQDFPLAIGAYESSINADSTQINAYVNLAHVYINDLKQPDTGYEWMKKVIEMNPDNLDLRIMLAKNYQSNEQNELALQTFQEVLEKDPNNRQAADGVRVLGVEQ